MRVIYNKSTDPRFNLAAEEFLAENFSEDVFMLWRNSASVIIGKNQNMLEEVDADFTERENIPVIRRITGGGAVFHDEGNVNYTFITRYGGEIDFEKFASPVISALKEMGINAVLGGRNDITAEGFKISGNAQCRVKCKDGYSTLHHGTLLFSADLSRLSGALKPSKLKLLSKGIKSVSSRVKNISEFESYNGPKTAEAFIEKLFSLMALGETEGFTSEETDCIKKLSENKYGAWEWNCGSSPAFEITNSARFEFGTVSARINCKGSKIERIKLYGDFFGEDTEELEGLLSGVPYERTAVKKRLEEINAGKYIFGADADSFCALIFDIKE